MTRNPPPTSAVPSPSSIFMPPTSQAPETRTASSTTAEPTPLPRRPLGDQEQKQHDQEDHGRSNDSDDSDDTFPLPKLRLHIQDAMHPGAQRFLAAVNAPPLMSRSVQTVLRLLYVSPRRHKSCDDEEEDGAAEQQRPARPHYTPPPTRSVTLILEDMDGVAYTKGMDLDNDHKEIHLSMGYVKGIRKAPTPASFAPTTGRSGDDVAGAYEIEGVLVHELVHCYQYNGKGKCPGGLVEGIADWVRLSARLGAPHWRRDTVPERWDQGYERTAYFLDWLEENFGRGTVRRMNEALRVREYKESEFWTDLFGHGVDVLWEQYLKTLKKDGHD